MKRFMIVIDKADREERAKITALLKESPCRWWHWMSNLWLIADRSEQSAATSWLSQIQPLVNENTRILITEVEVSDWVALVPDGAEIWLDKNWRVGGGD
jgi:hypothetical protein